MGPDLHHPQHAEALAGAPAPTPRREATGAEQEPNGEPERIPIVGELRAIRCAAEREWTQR